MKKSKLYFYKKLIAKEISQLEWEISYCRSFNCYDEMVMSEFILYELERKLRRLEKKL
jgi:hypothetical protein